MLLRDPAIPASGGMFHLYIWTKFLSLGVVYMHVYTGLDGRLNEQIVRLAPKGVCTAFNVFLWGIFFYYHVKKKAFNFETLKKISYSFY